MCSANQLGVVSSNIRTMRFNRKSSVSTTSVLDGRRCQSAQAFTRPSTSGVKHVRSHSSEPRRSQGVPIPQKDRRTSVSVLEEKNDLTRIYDYATWNMYERIVNARRQRLSWLEAQKHESCPATNAVDPSNIATNKPAGLGSVLSGVHKAPEREDTDSTADETDKSSTIISSASSVSTASGTSTPAAGTAATKPNSIGVSSEQEPDGGSEECFIFELDM